MFICFHYRRATGKARESEGRVMDDLRNLNECNDRRLGVAKRLLQNNEIPLNSFCKTVYIDQACFRCICLPVCFYTFVCITKDTIFLRWDYNLPSSKPVVKLLYNVDKIIRIFQAYGD